VCGKYEYKLWMRVEKKYGKKFKIPTQLYKAAHAIKKFVHLPPPHMSVR
jgi:hypothetical protein